jgi:hypothetical protein
LHAEKTAKRVTSGEFHVCSAATPADSCRMLANERAMVDNETVRDVSKAGNLEPPGYIRLLLVKTSRKQEIWQTRGHYICETLCR